MKIFWCDLETTGVKPEENGIIQIAGQIEIDGKVEEDFNFDVCPFKGQIVTADALKVTGKTLEQIREYQSPQSVYRDLMILITSYVDKFNRQDKFFFAAYNANFDMSFLRAFWENNNDNYFGSLFFYPYLDVMALAAFELLEHRPFMPNFKLATVAKHYGIEVDDEATHDGQYDIELTKKIYNEILSKRG